MKQSILVAFIFIAFVFLGPFATAWVFNHVNVWVGILAAVIISVSAALITYKIIHK